MAIADNVYVDPSALLKLYLNEPESRDMAAWRARHTGPLVVTLHGRVEMVNGLALARNRRYLADAAYAAGLAALDDDFEEGRYRVADLLWRATLRRTEDLSRRFTAIHATRTLDVLHVASAVELGIKRFLTFDSRQRNLAREVGLRLVETSG